MNTGRISIDPYKQLPLIKNQQLKLSSSDPYTPAYVKSIVTNSSNPAGIYASRVQGQRILLENPARDSKVKKEREEKKARRRVNKERKKLGIIGKREAKEKGVWRFDKAQAEFELFLPLHRLWLGYMSELLALSCSLPSLSTPPTVQSMPSAAGMHAKLVKADFHGSILTIRQSKNPCLVGISGVVVHETENAFKVVTRNDEIKLLPKQNSIFAFAVPLFSTLSLATLLPAVSKPAQNQDTQLHLPDNQETVLDRPHIEFELYGNHFRFRSADRAGRKFKHKETIEL